NKVEMGIRNDRYKAMVPTVTGPLKLRGRVHGPEARHARAHTKRKLKITMPGPMTIIDTIADRHYGDRVTMAFAFADLLIDVASDAIETAEDVAATIESVLKYVPKERIIAGTNCGMAPMGRDIAIAKLDALGRGAALARKRLG